MQPRILVATYPAQGHINPSLQLAKLLIRAGAHVTFFISSSAATRMAKPPAGDGLEFATFSNGYDDRFENGDDDLHKFMSELEHLGTQALTKLITARADQGQPFSCLLYGVGIPWAAEVAQSLHLPSVLVWSQPATVFDIYYYYFNGNQLIQNDDLPGLPSLTVGDLPSLLFPAKANSHDFILKLFQKHIQQLNRENNPKVLINSFDPLESDALKAIKKFKVMGIGPLLPSAFLDGKDPSDTSFGGDLFRNSKDYFQWLNTNSGSSVIYVSFGSIAVLSKRQSEEIARGLLDSRRPFLWVIRENAEGEKEAGKLNCVEELEQQGMIVPWCSQVEVLSHPSVGCFLTHCGWNSTLESLACGVPVVAFPQWADQSTNAKLIEDVWKTGVRAMVKNQEGIVEGDEIKNCLELVMGGGERGKEMRRNAKK